MVLIQKFFKTAKYTKLNNFDKIKSIIKKMWKIVENSPYLKNS
jgi:hypothetical protein